MKLCGQNEKELLINPLASELSALGDMQRIGI
jgi:hypothetical protein